jgi:hypothetical protein
VKDIVDPRDVVVVARALNVDPRTVRSDTPLTSVGWSGTAGEWAVVSDHLGYPIDSDPPQNAEPATIGDLVAIVVSIHERSMSSTSAPGDTAQSRG